MQLVTSECVGDKVHQRVVANLGRLEELQAGSLDRLIEHLARFSQRQWVLEKVRQIEAKRARTWGPVLIFRRLWEELGLAATFKGLLEGTAVETDFEVSGATSWFASWRWSWRWPCGVIRALGEDISYDDLLFDLSQLKAGDLCVDGRRYLARTELTGRAEIAFRAVGVRPPLHVTDMP
ncbi:hypothetical protein [Neomoorella thermoacetica]|uniref:hypothetical protein n=1 Tax=Neomoorella thermoacetica TaxID=1525 RepID=UPI000915910F|nr:hypothetical protein [Moorella thermoacetica]OIQ60446.1 hypothetical protein MTIN_17930 [Moorella thermoacetica]